MNITGTSTRSAGPANISDRLRAAVADGNEALVADLIENHALECWFGVPPGDLIAILQQIPSEIIQQKFVVNQLHALLTGRTIDEATIESQLQRLPEDEARVRRIMFDSVKSMGLRISGRIAEAAQLDAENEITPSRNFFAVDLNSWYTFQKVQRGITAMLAGDFARALTEFAWAQSGLVSNDLTFLNRDAYVKSALIHALFGDERLARAHLETASRITRTGSWAEVTIDACVVLTEGALAPAEQLDEVLRRVDELPMPVVGEIWPYYVVTLQNIHERRGSRVEFISRVEGLRDAGFLGADTGGFPGSVLANSLAINLFVLGDVSGAREHVKAADPDLITTRLVRSLIEIASSRPDRALQLTSGLRAETRTLRQLEIWRTSIAVKAMLALGDDEAAKLNLARLLIDVGELREQEIDMFSREIHEFAQDYVDGWPAIDSAVPRIIRPVMKQVILSAREREVLTLVALGMGRAEVAEHLFLSLNTVKTHLSSLFRKFDVANRAQLLSEAKKRALI